MPTDDDYDLPDLDELTGSGGGGGEGRGEPRGGGSRTGSRRRWPWLLAGLVIGALGALFLPELLAPYLPDALRAGGEELDGPVVAKRVEGDRLLLTVDTERGALLAVIRRRVPEIDLLVEEGDSVTLSVDRYAPLLEDPVLAAVRKPDGPRIPVEPEGEEPAGGGADDGPAEVDGEDGGAPDADVEPQAREADPDAAGPADGGIP